MSGDPRVTLARPDLADQALEGLISAERFETARPMRCVRPVAAVRASPRPDAEQLDQVVFGECFNVLDARDGYAWGQAARDGYVGWVRKDALDEAADEPTHRIAALSTFAFAEPAVRSRASGPFSLNALVRVVDRSGTFALVDRAGWMPEAHLRDVGLGFERPADTAERFHGAPYLWGGRTSLGVDCSGLVQQALYAAGLACPRDTDQQAALGNPVSPADLERGDLVFWEGHAGLMLDDRRLIHANAFHMAVAIEPLAAAATRIAASGGGEPTAFRRPPLSHRKGGPAS